MLPDHRVSFSHVCAIGDADLAFDHSAFEALECRIYHVTGIGESLAEEAIGERISAISGVELLVIAHAPETSMSESSANRSALDQADKIIRTTLGDSIYPRTKLLWKR